MLLMLLLSVSRGFFFGRGMEGFVVLVLLIPACSVFACSRTWLRLESSRREDVPVRAAGRGTCVVDEVCFICCDVRLILFFLGCIWWMLGELFPTFVRQLRQRYQRFQLVCRG